MSPVGEYLVGYVLDEFAKAEVSLHSADPGRSGAHELNGNRYERQTPPSYDRIAGDGLRSTSEVMFTRLPRSDVRYVGFWCNGQFLGGQQVTERHAQIGDGYRIAKGAITVYQMMVE
jgi:hypothetical protein